MKLVTLKFLTKKGVDAYWAIEEEGKKQSWKDRKISQAVASDSVTCMDPLTVQIEIKISWLAVKAKMDEQIIAGLAKKGCKKDVDYTMEVV